MFLTQVPNGLQLGSICALVCRLHNMYGIILLLNFAHGDIIMFGSLRCLDCACSVRTQLAIAVLSSPFWLYCAAFLLIRFHAPPAEAPRFHSDYCNWCLLPIENGVQRCFGRADAMLFQASLTWELFRYLVSTPSTAL